MRGNLQEGPPRHGKSYSTWKRTSSHCVVGSLPLSVFCSTLENMSSSGDRALEGVVRKGEGLMTFARLLFSEGMPAGSNLPRVSCRESQRPWIRW